MEASSHVDQQTPHDVAFQPGGKPMANVITNVAIVVAMVATMVAVNYPYLIQ
jgi:hypothetical protein